MDNTLSSDNLQCNEGPSRYLKYLEMRFPFLMQNISGTWISTFGSVPYFFFLIGLVIGCRDLFVCFPFSSVLQCNVWLTDSRLHCCTASSAKQDHGAIEEEHEHCPVEVPYPTREFFFFHWGCDSTWMCVCCSASACTPMCWVPAHPVLSSCFSLDHSLSLGSISEICK